MNNHFDTIKSWLPYIKEDQSREGIRAEHIAALEHNNRVLTDALWKACGDDDQMVNDYIESQGALK